MPALVNLTVFSTLTGEVLSTHDHISVEEAEYIIGEYQHVDAQIEGVDEEELRLAHLANLDADPRYRDPFQRPGWNGLASEC